MEKKFTKIIEKGLTYGQAMDKCIHEGKKVAREHWGGYWYRHDSVDIGEEYFMLPTIVAHLKTGGYTTATPYNEDKFSRDWMVVK